ncbi:MAG: PIG-L family deacetylase [Caldilineae bacterium]|nr:MAG: PIG-L family deacetylase [Caldilineae bacterium]
MTEAHNDILNSFRTVLVIMAHPDDAEFCCAGSVKKMSDAGAEITYIVLTNGDKGNHNLSITVPELVKTRMEEQRKAAAMLGVKEVIFMGEEDGFLEPNRELRRRLVRHIRRIKPDLIICQTPELYFRGDNYINHPDHRNAGLATIEAIFPAAGNPMFFPDLIAEGYPPHSIRELWMCMTPEPNLRIDITDLIDLKIEAVKQHVSQFDDLDRLERWIRERWGEEDEAGRRRYFESFKRMSFGD